MEGFLRSCSEALKRCSEDGSKVHVVLGNEACDLDSMVSALAFAYFLYKVGTVATSSDKGLIMRVGNSTSSGSGKVTVPLLNIRRAELALRTDNTFLLRQCGLPLEALLFRDDVDLAGLHKAGQLALTLVDHNVLHSSDSDLETAVLEVIDHRQLERTPSSLCPVTVEMVGSCSTLVTERIAQKAPEVLDQQVAQLLYGAIVLDCVNMAPEAGKVTPKDSQYAVWLESRFPDLPPRGALFQSLQTAKFDVSGLTTEQMLLKDMKAVSGGDLALAVSVVYMTLDAFLQRRCLQQELCEFCHKHRFGLLVAMTMSFNKKNEPFRQLAVYSSSTLYREEVSQALDKAQNPCLNLSPMSSPYADVKAYLQGNTLASRKKVLPIIKDFLREWERRTVHCGDVEDLELEDQFDPSRSPSMDDETRTRRYSASRQRRAVAEDIGAEEDCQVPPTPMNSLVEGCPLDNGLPKISPEAILEKFSKMANPEATEGKGVSGGH